MSDGQQNQKQQPEAPKQGHARIPVKTIWLREAMDFPGNSNMERIDCSPQTLEGRQYFVAHFVPAHQVIELEWYRSEKFKPYCTRIALAAVKRFD